VTIADIEVLSTGPVPSECLIGVEEFFNVPSFGIVKGESVSLIIVGCGKKCFESPIAWLLTEPLNELEERIGFSVCELKGKLCSGKTGPSAIEAFRGNIAELFTNSRLHGHGNQHVKLRIPVYLIEEFLGEVLCISEDQHAGFIRLKDLSSQLEQLGSSL